MKSDNALVFPCGILHGEVILDRFEVKEMTGKEEDVLASRNLSIDKKLDEILTNCITKICDKDSTIELTERGDIQNAVGKLTIADRTVAMLGLRVTSLDEIFRMKTQCPACNVSFRSTVNLKGLPIIEMKDKKKILENKGVYERILPNGKKVMLKLMTREISERLRGQIERNDRDSLSLAIAMRLVEIDGKKPALADIKSLSLKERNFLRKQFNEVEGGVDTIIDFTCPSCDNRFSAMLDVGQADFFFPSGM